jgi:hypothetical protein
MQVHWWHAEGLSRDDRRRVEERLGALAREQSDLIESWIDVRPNGTEGRRVSVTCHAWGWEIAESRVRPALGEALTEAIDAIEEDVRRMRLRHRAPVAVRPGVRKQRASGGLRTRRARGAQ